MSSQEKFCYTAHSSWHVVFDERPCVLSLVNCVTLSTSVSLSFSFFMDNDMHQGDFKMKLFNKGPDNQLIIIIINGNTVPYLIIASQVQSLCLPELST